MRKERELTAETGPLSNREIGLVSAGATSEPEIISSLRPSPEDQENQRTYGIAKAREAVGETLDSHEVNALIEGLDFSPEKSKFIVTSNYRGEAVAHQTSSRSVGELEHVQSSGYDRQWGNLRDEANNAERPVEKVGVRLMSNVMHSTQEKTVKRRGVAGLVGMTKQVEAYALQAEPPSFQFDYAFEAPTHGDEAARAAGNFTGQSVRLGLELTQYQALQLSGILNKSPAVARTILDAYVRETGDIAKWNTELFDEAGKFHDPGERYGKELLARDVRPHFESVSDLVPEVVGLVTSEDVVAEAEHVREAKHSPDAV